MHASNEPQSLCWRWCGGDNIGVVHWGWANRIKDDRALESDRGIYPRRSAPGHGRPDPGIRCT